MAEYGKNGLISGVAATDFWNVNQKDGSLNAAIMPCQYEVIYPESEQIKKIVHHYEWYKFENTIPESYVFYPSFVTGLRFVFSNSGSLLASNNDYKNIPIGDCSFMSPSTQPVRISNMLNQEVIRVVFQIGGMHQVYGINMYRHQNTFSSGVAELDRDLETVYKEMKHQGYLRKKIALFEDYLLKKMNGLPLDYSTCKGLFNSVSKNDFSWRVKDLAREVGQSEGNLYRFTTSQIGLSPKSLIRIARFINILSALQIMDEHEYLIKVAYDFNYCDQAHFIRDFASLAGMTPNKYLSQIFSNDIQISLEDLLYRNFEMMWKRKKVD